MKKLPVFLLIILSALSVGKTVGQTYSINKKVYDHRQYVPRFGDVYDPMLMGGYSAVLPGMGQMICRETGRGVAFMVPGVIAYTAIGVGTVRGFQESNRDFWENKNSRFKDDAIKDDADIGLPLIIGGIVGAIIINTWSFIDAVKVAKVTNMYFCGMCAMVLCLLSSRSAALLPLSPLRTVRESFPSYGSSNSKFLFIRNRLIYF